MHVMWMWMWMWLWLWLWLVTFLIIVSPAIRYRSRTCTHGPRLARRSCFPSSPRRLRLSLSARVRSINAKVGAVHVQAGVTREERDGAHQILRASHLTHGDEGSPLLLQLWIVVKDLLGTAAR